jgi:hypothetical protein
VSEPIDLRALLLDNPELRRNLQIELSPKRMFTAGIITALYALIVLPSLLSANRAFPPPGVTQYLMVVLWSQKITLTLGGAIACWRAIRRERELNTFDFQRITRLSPLELAIGKLFGAPALAYFVTLCLAVPAIISAATTSPTAVSLLWHSYILLFTSSLMIHAFALMISTVSDKGGAFSGIVLLLILQIFPLIGWLTVMSHMNPAQTTATSFSPFNFYGMPIPPTVLWPTIELGFAAWLLSSVVRNIKVELEAMQLFSLRQGLGFALYSNFVWIGSYPFRAVGNSAALAPLLLWCVLIFYAIGVGVLQSRELVRRELREAGAADSAAPKLFAPVASMVIAAALTSLFILAFSQHPISTAGRLNTARNSAFVFVYLIAWLARDLFYLQWMKVRPVRSPMRKALLYLGVFYVSSSIVFRSALGSVTTDSSAFSTWLAPFAILSTWSQEQWDHAAPMWFVALAVQIASAAAFAYLYRQEVLALAPQPSAAPRPPASPRLSSKPA